MLPSLGQRARRNDRSVRVMIGAGGPDDAQVRGVAGVRQNARPRIMSQMLRKTALTRMRRKKII
jgi:hypothetical protein